MILAGDIGGTNTRLGLFKEEGSALILVAEKKYASNSWQELQSLIDHFLKSSGMSSSSIETGCLSLAGPVEENHCILTNLSKDVDFVKIRDRFSPFPFSFCNDLVATGYGLKTLKPDQLLRLASGQAIGTDAGDKKSQNHEELNQAILAPGTGLGESLMIQGKYITPTEGAHTDFAPRNELEIRLWRYLHHVYGHVSYERILSGPGLTNLYGFFLQESKSSKTVSLLPSPEEISEKGRADHTSLYYRTLKLFFDILGAEAGNLALKSLALGGVYIGGGIVQKIHDLLNTDEFLNAFRDKGRFRDLLERIPVYLILEEKTALYGAAKYAFEHKNSDPQK